MLLHIKLSKDNTREIHLKLEEGLWSVISYYKGTIIDKETFKNKDNAFSHYDKIDIGETY